LASTIVPPGSSALRLTGRFRRAADPPGRSRAVRSGRDKAGGADNRVPARACLRDRVQAVILAYETGIVVPGAPD